MKITVVGIGYVGLSNALLLAQHNKVIALDIDSDKVDKVNNGISPIEDPEISLALKGSSANLIATTDIAKAYDSPEIVVIATPTNYDEKPTTLIQNL